MKRRDNQLRLRRFRVDELQRRLGTLEAIEADLGRKFADLEETVRRLLSLAEERERLGKNAREFVMKQQGATDRTIECLDQLIGSPLKKAA